MPSAKNRRYEPRHGRKQLGPRIYIVQIASYEEISEPHHQKDRIQNSKFTKFGYVSL